MSLCGQAVLFLLADIGATNARFHLADESGLCGDPVVFATADFASQTDLFAAVSERLGLCDYQQIVVAAAGPRDEQGVIRTTNTGLELSQHVMSQYFSAPASLVNDFYALAYGVPHYTNLIQVGGNADSQGTKAILGPGTGLGMAGIVALGGAWHVVPTEGGHTGLAPGNHLEVELWGILSQTLDHVSWEAVLSGPGLVNLYRAICTLWGSNPDELEPADIVTQGVDMHSPVCHQTLETFAGLLGSAAGNLALMFLAKGGVYLAGGVAQKLTEFLISSPMRRRFEERGPMTDMISRVPVYLVCDEEPGLQGACHLARDLAHQKPG